MSQSADKPEIPAQVQQLMDEVSQFKGVEPVLRVINSRHWQVSFTLPPSPQAPQGVHITLDLRRTSGGRVTKPSVTVSHKGVTGTLPQGWRTLMTNVGRHMASPPVVPDIEEQPLDRAPSQVRRQYDALIRALGENAQSEGVRIRVGREDDRWVVGIDGRTCECDTMLCMHSIAIRIYFRRKGNSWRADNGHFLAVVRGMDMSEEWRGRDNKILALLSGRLPDVSTTPDHSQPSGTSSAPATTANSVVTRKTTVIRN